MEPTLSYQESDSDPRHVKAVEPSLDVESDLLSVLALLPLEHALRDGSHRGVVTPLDGLERPGETFVVLVDLWWPLCFRSRPCVVIPATVKGRERSSAILFFFFSQTRSVITVPLFNWYPESASSGPISIGAAAVCALLESWIWCRDGEGDVALSQCSADIRRERDGREVDQFLREMGVVNIRWR